MRSVSLSAALICLTLWSVAALAQAPQPYQYAPPTQTQQPGYTLYQSPQQPVYPQGMGPQPTYQQPYAQPAWQLPGVTTAPGYPSGPSQTGQIAPPQGTPLILEPVGQTPGTAADFPSVRVDFQVMSTEVPEGWRAYLALGDTTVGAFGIILQDPNGRMEVRFAHNWLILLDRQVGGYLPGNMVMERCVLPIYAQEIQSRQYQYEGVLSRSANTRTLFSDPSLAAFGVQIPRDEGTLVFAVRHPRGERLIGRALAQTLRIYDMPDPMFGQHNGVFSVQFAAMTVAPDEPAAQQFAGRILEHMVGTLVLSQEYLNRWREGVRQGARLGDEYSDSVSSLVEETETTATGASSRATSDQWVAYMRGGEYLADPTTGQNHWVTNDYSHWFVDRQGNVVGSNTGDPPSYDRDWRRLVPGD